MPRKRTRPQRPLTFSPFARSMAMVACCKKARRKIKEPKSKDMDLASSSGNGFVDHGKGDADSSDSEGFEGILQADFVFFDPQPDDFHGVKILLRTYLDDNVWDLTGFVDLILGQPTVGTVVKIEDDEDNGVYSVISCLNLGRYRDSLCIIQLKDYLLSRLQDMDMIAKLRLLFGEQEHDVGLVVSQRVMNLPNQLLPPLHDALFDEVEWATEDEPSEVLRDSFRFKTYLFISKVYKHKHKRGGVRRGELENGEEEAVIFTKPEDEIFLELSSWSFTFPLREKTVTTSELKDYKLTGLVMAVDASKIPVFRTRLRSLIVE